MKNLKLLMYLWPMWVSLFVLVPLGFMLELSPTLCLIVGFLNGVVTANIALALHGDGIHDILFPVFDPILDRIYDALY